MLPGNDKRTEMDSMIRSTERITSCLEFFQHVIELHGKKMFEFFFVAISNINFPHSKGLYLCLTNIAFSSK